MRALHALTPDLHAAWAFAAEHDRELALRMVADVYDFAYFRQRLDLLGWGLTAAAWPIEDPRHAPALGTAAAALWSAGRLPEAAETAERSITLAGGRDTAEAALALNVSGDIAMFLGRTDDAVERYRRHGAVADPTGRRVPGLITALSIAHALINGRRAERGRGGARRRGSERPAHRQPHDADLGALPLRRAGQRQRPRAGGRRVPCGGRLRHAGGLAAVRHDRPQLGRRARRAHRRSGRGIHRLPQVLDQWLRLGNAAAAFFLMPHVAVALARAGADRDAAMVAGAVRAHIHQMPGFAVDAERLETALAQVRARLGHTTTDAALAEGEALSLPAGLAAARRALAARTAQPFLDEYSLHSRAARGPSAG